MYNKLAYMNKYLLSFIKYLSCFKNENGFGVKKLIFKYNKYI